MTGLGAFDLYYSFGTPIEEFLLKFSGIWIPDELAYARSGMTARGFPGAGCRSWRGGVVPGREEERTPALLENPYEMSSRQTAVNLHIMVNNWSF